jgi:microsomal dipeptidase-like Zn-dependent dipeptidase
MTHKGDAIRSEMDDAGPVKSWISAKISRMGCAAISSQPCSANASITPATWIRMRSPTLEVTTADQILFGTDWAAAPEPTVVRNITNLTCFDGFTQAELRGVERDNALRLLPRLA